jgi:hypothetical protein
MDGDEMEEEQEVAPPAPALTAAAKGKGKATGAEPGGNAPWVDKFRPATLADVVAHKDIIDTSACPPRPGQHTAVPQTQVPPTPPPLARIACARAWAVWVERGPLWFQ